jgi:AbrB family looped-hinge helix DNA binding protein
MSKVTSKYQVTMPKRIADTFAIRPGDEIDWVAAGDVIRVIPPGSREQAVDRQSQLRLFDQATERLRKRWARTLRLTPIAQSGKLRRLGWFDAHLWACAAHHGIETIFMEGIRHDRPYGSVRAVNPFAGT